MKPKDWIGSNILMTSEDRCTGKPSMRIAITEKTIEKTPNAVNIDNSLNDRIQLMSIMGIHNNAIVCSRGSSSSWLHICPIKTKNPAHPPTQDIVVAVLTVDPQYDDPKYREARSG